MKKIIYTLLALCFLMSCDDDFDIADQGFDLEPLPESVSFDGGGDGIDADDDGDEGDDITITVEAPNGSEADIVVTYTLSGTATFGTDYTIAGATASGGSVTIIDDRSDVVNFDNGDIDIVLLNDCENGEEDETIIITLESATRGSEQIAVGRGGTDFGKTVTVTISDVAQDIAMSPTSISATESSVADTLSFDIDLGYAAVADVTFDLSIETDSSSLMQGTDFMFDASESTPGSITIAEGESSSTVKVILIDDGALSTAPDATDSLRFLISNVTSSCDVEVGSSAVQIDIRDDVKEYGFGMSSDTTAVSEVTTYNYTVEVADTLSGSPSAAFSDLTITYSVNTGTAVAGVDFNDITGGTITIPAGATSADISIQVIRVGEMTPPVLTIALTGGTTMDAEILGASDNNTLNIAIE